MHTLGNMSNYVQHFQVNFHFFFSYSCNKLKLAKYENAINFNYLLLSIGQNKLHFAIPVQLVDT